jgi:tripartite-type tricarboxylate transporter receptor subunit TctC
MFKNSIRNAVAALALLLGSSAAMAQDYPSQPVNVIVAFSPGGANDTIGRLFAEALTQRTGQQFLVENLPGANGSIGTATAAGQPADGYHLALSSPATLLQNPYLFGDVGYTSASLVPAARLAALDFVVVVRPDLGVATLEDLVQYSKDNPDSVNYGSPGIGNTAHQAGELLKTRTGADLVHIPYQGGGPATTAFLAGEVDVLFNTVSEVMPYIQSGDAVALAVMSPDRLALLPDVPTLEELGIEDSNVSSWIGLFAPAGTPTEVIDFLNAEVSEIIEDETVKARLAELGFRAGNASPADLAAEIVALEPAMIELIDLTGGPQ